MDELTAREQQVEAYLEKAHKEMEELVQGSPEKLSESTPDELALLLSCAIIKATLYPDIITLEWADSVLGICQLYVKVCLAVAKPVAISPVLAAIQKKVEQVLKQKRN